MSVFAVTACCFGLVARLCVLILSGNQPVGRLSGTGDQIRYQTLADSIFQGKGFAYAGQPTALRPPLYPLLLAASRVLFGSRYLLALRIFQFLVGILVAYFCLLLARRLFGIGAALPAGALALALPTLIYPAAELQTEELAVLVTLLFIFSLLDALENARGGAIRAGVFSGLAMLLRFNSALLAPLGALAFLWRDRKLKRVLVFCATAALLLVPWVVRNAVVFHGNVFYSTHGGINLLEGVLTPEGRAQRGEEERVRAAAGWLHTDIETNNVWRLKFPGEDRLDGQARLAAISAWKSLDWHSLLRILAGKVACFWFSTDQLFSTGSFSRAQRGLRAAGVITYWIVLALAVLGWRRLLALNKPIAVAVAFFALFITLAHLPFVMNTRLRIPFLEPLLAVLAAGGICFLINRFGTPSSAGNPSAAS